MFFSCLFFLSYLSFSLYIFLSIVFFLSFYYNLSFSCLSLIMIFLSSLYYFLAYLSFYLILKLTVHHFRKIGNWWPRVLIIGTSFHSCALKCKAQFGLPFDGEMEFADLKSCLYIHVVFTINCIINCS